MIDQIDLDQYDDLELIHLSQIITTLLSRRAFNKDQENGLCCVKHPLLNSEWCRTPMKVDHTIHNSKNYSFGYTEDGKK